jgi:triphosphoribosyl-dephospho-CoA synthase
VRGPLSSSEIARAFHDACLAELDALKPGNVHRHAPDERMSVEDFELSARVSAPALSMPMISVGPRIRLAVEATIAIVGHNTNLGIILLAAPLASAALDSRSGDLRERLAKTLSGLRVEDAKETYAAIRHAKPGGLGETEAHDVAEEPGLTLLEAMRAAETRDRIAWNYTHGFADIFDLGLPRLAAGEADWGSLPHATSFVYLGFLASIPDTLIERKFGLEAAREVMLEASGLAAEMAKSKDPQGLAPKLLAFDRSLKERGLNPGTSADLTVATLFAGALQTLEGRG